MKVSYVVSILNVAFLASLVGFIVLLAHRLMFEPPEVCSVLMTTDGSTRLCAIWLKGP